MQQVTFLNECITICESVTESISSLFCILQLLQCCGDQNRPELFSIVNALLKLWHLSFPSQTYCDITVGIDPFIIFTQQKQNMPSCFFIKD